MINRIYFVLTAVSALLFSTMSGPIHAGASLSDVLNDVCVEPLCKNYSGNKRIVSSDGTKIAVKDWSAFNKDKPTFLFIHGFPHGQGLWTPQVISLLPLKYRLVTMDTRGSGGSDVPVPGKYEAINYGDDIEAVINSLKLKNVILVGHSYGGVVINSYVATHGLSKIKGIILVAAIPNFGNALIPQNIEDLVPLTLSSDPAVFLQATKDFVALSHFKPFPQFLENAVVEMDLETPLQGRIGQITSTFASSDSTAIVRTINVPVLLVHGEKDAVILPATSNFWQANLTHSPKVKRINLSNTGHFVPLESPVQFNDAISDFAKSLKY